MKIPTWLEDGYPSTTYSRYWCRTPMGLEAIAVDEIEEQIPVAGCFQSHRNVFFCLRTDGDGVIAPELSGLRTVDDVFQYLGCCRGVSRSKDSVQVIVDWLQGAMPSMVPLFSGSRYIRLTVSFVGKRNFNRYSVEERLNTVIAAHTNLSLLSNERPDAKVAGELRLRCHIEDDVAFFGFSSRDTPLHRRSWRQIRYTGQLHPPVAAAMLRLLQPQEQACIFDPFCGSGTLLIEAAIRYPEGIHMGIDLSEEAVEIARQSAAMAAVQLRLGVGDFLAQSPPAMPYYMLSNPPWDEKHVIQGHLKEVLLERMATWVMKSRGAVLLLPEDLVEILIGQLDCSAKRMAQTRIRGKLAWLVRFTTAHREA